MANHTVATSLLLLYRQIGNGLIQIMDAQIGIRFDWNLVQVVLMSPQYPQQAAGLHTVNFSN